MARNRKAAGLQTAVKIDFGEMHSRPLIIILNADNVLLAEVAAGLGLDQLQHNLAGIFERSGYKSIPSRARS
jgi:hypothetical protein